MTMPLSFDPGRLIEAAAAALFHFLWQGAAIAGLLAIALHAGRRRSAKARCLAAVGALAVMAACPIVTSALAYQSAGRTRVEIIYGRRVPGGEPDALRAGASAAPEPARPSWLPLSARAVTAAVRRGAPWIVLIWAAGAGILAIRIIGGWLVAQRLAQHAACSPSGELDSLLQRLAVRLRVARPPRLVVSQAIAAPILLGAFRGAIVLPIGMVTGLSDRMVEAILAHELAHVLRHDYLINVVQCIVEALLFFHPAVWWVSGRIRIEREHACDDLVLATLNDPQTYARALAGLEAMRAAQPMTLAATGGPLLARIHRILGVTPMHTNNRSLFAAGVACVAIAGLCGAVCLRAEPADDGGSAIPIEPARATAAANPQAPQPERSIASGAAPTAALAPQAAPGSRASAAPAAASGSPEPDAAAQAAPRAPAKPAPSMPRYLLEMKVLRCVVSAAGVRLDSIGAPKVMTVSGTNARIGVSGGATRYAVDALPTAARKGAVRLAVTMRVPEGAGNGASGSATQTVSHGQSVLILGITSATDPTIRRHVLAGRAVAGHGDYTAYYLEIKPILAP